MRVRLTETRAQHNASQPLLRLPDETKAQIWKLVCGEHLLHMEQDESDDDTIDQARKWPKLVSKRCYAKATEEEIEKEFLADSDDGLAISQYVTIHENCSYDQNVWPASIDLRWMRTCRQIYNESIQLPLSTLYVLLHPVLDAAELCYPPCPFQPAFVASSSAHIYLQGVFEGRWVSVV